MAEQSAIAWTRSTFNPWIGCTKVSPGCDHCYASVSTPARAMKIKWGPGQPRQRTSASNWKLPLRWNEAAPHTTFAGRKGFWPVFCSSLADVFDNEVPDQWRMDLFTLIANTPNLTWLLLTKRIGNVEKMATHDGLMFEMLATRVWLGATIVDHDEADRDIPKLLNTPAARRFVSYEPALGPVDFGLRCENWSDDIVMDPETGAYECCRACDGTGIGNNLDWIIVGGESDQPSMKARPFDVEWARSTVRQCKAACVPVFVKQLGSAPFDSSVRIVGGSRTLSDPPTDSELMQLGSLMDAMGAIRDQITDRAGADPAEWPEDLRVQEFPQ